MSNDEAHVIQTDRHNLKSVSLADDGTMTKSEYVAATHASDGTSDPLNRTLAEVEREHILAVLDRNNWNRTRSAKILGIDVKTLYNKLKSYRVTKAGEAAAS